MAPAQHHLGSARTPPGRGHGLHGNEPQRVISSETAHDVLPGVAVMKALAKRVTAMERPRPLGCPTCRYWNRMIVVTIEEDGTETG